MTPILVSVSEACALLGIKKTKVYELIGNQQIETMKLGRRRLVKVASLQALVEGKAT